MSTKQRGLMHTALKIRCITTNPYPQPQQTMRHAQVKVVFLLQERVRPQRVEVVGWQLETCTAFVHFRPQTLTGMQTDRFSAIHSNPSPTGTRAVRIPASIDGAQKLSVSGLNCSLWRRSERMRLECSVWGDGGVAGSWPSACRSCLATASSAGSSLGNSSTSGI